MTAKKVKLTKREAAVVRKALAFMRPKRWTKGTFARDAVGQHAGINGAEAVCWCWKGAIYKHSPGGHHIFAKFIDRYDLLVESSNDFDGYAKTRARLRAMLPESSR